MPKLVIGVVGMPGAGKSLVASLAEESGISVVIMGDVIREEALLRGLELTSENIGQVMLNIRSKEGPAVVAKRCIPKINSKKSNIVLVEGVRSLDEVIEFKRNFTVFKLLAVHSSPQTRFTRLFNRNRSDDPVSKRVFEQRDARELSVGIGSAIAMADHVIVNECNKKEFLEKVSLLLSKITQDPCGAQ